MPTFLTDSYAAPSFMMVMDSNFTVYQHYTNLNEIEHVDGGFGSLVNETSLLLQQMFSARTSFPIMGNFNDPINGRLYFRITAMQFDAPIGQYTYFLITG